MNNLLRNPLFKAVFTNVVGAVAVGVDAAIQGGPTGGFAAYLTAHPQIVPIYLITQQFTHNLISRYLPPTNVVTKG